jgi:hypothetical protein
VNRTSPGLEDIDGPDGTDWAPQEIVELAKVFAVVDDGGVAVVNSVAKTGELTRNRCHDRALHVTVLVSFADAVD